jgi:two-component system chemotaxis sensor kinase CheA
MIFYLLGGIIMQTVMDTEAILEQTAPDLLEKILKNTNIKPLYQPGSPVYPIIEHLSRPGFCFSPDEKAETIYEALKLNPDITEFTVLEDNTAIGFMTRNVFNETLGGRFGFTLFSRNPIRDIMKSDFLRVDCNIPVDEVSRLAMQRPFERLYNPIVVEREGKYLGIVTVKDMLETCMNVALAERDEIAVMKDSLKIGLFFMNRDYVIQDHYSRYLEEILLESSLSGKTFPALLSASVSPKELETVRDYFEMIFTRTFDQNMLDDINPLNEIHYVSVRTGRQKVFHCGFSTIERLHGEVFALVTIYDITAKIELQQRLREEENKRQEEMKAIFELIQVEPQIFGDFLEDAEYEFDRINEILKTKAMGTHEVLVEIYQAIHAIKSNAVVLGLNTFGNKVHTLESKLKKLREQDEVSVDAMLNLVLDIETLVQEKNGFKKNIEKINSFKSSTFSEGRSQGEYVLIESLKKTVNKASADIGKKVKFAVGEIKGDAIERYRRLIKEVLVQLIRNSVVHGIEDPDYRTVNGKNATGLIRLTIKPEDGNIYVKLSDDGCGLNYEKIAERALRQNIIKKEEARSKDVLLKAIFSPGFSTAETEGIHAGRGMGLSLVQDRIRDARGSIKVQTQPGKGTTFNIYLPA